MAYISTEDIKVLNDLDLVLLNSEAINEPRVRAMIIRLEGVLINVETSRRVNNEKARNYIAEKRINDKNYARPKNKGDK